MVCKLKIYWLCKNQLGFVLHVYKLYTNASIIDEQIPTCKLLYSESTASIFSHRNTLLLYRSTVMTHH